MIELPSTSAPNTPPGNIYTFYSFKGGVGRSMALANVASLLSKWGRRVLIVDWDLEAPGIEQYFERKEFPFHGSRSKTPGIVDLVVAYSEGNQLDWTECLLRAEPFSDSPSISIISSGIRDPAYFSRVQSLRWDVLFDEHSLGMYIEDLRRDWISNFDVVLLDSRTGITDIGGICTVHLPDVLVVFFTSNNQSLDGVVEVVNRARRSHSLLPLDRHHLPVLPIPSRDESRTEYESALKWRREFAEKLGVFFADWLPVTATASEALELLRIPNVPYWSFGERLPVVEEGTSDPQSIGFAYSVLAKLVASDLQWSTVFEGVVEIDQDGASVAAVQDAELAYQRLTPNQRQAARQLLLRLVHVSQPGEQIADRRQSSRLKDLDDRLRSLVHPLVQLRILVVNEDETGEERVQITDAGLIRAWDRLGRWLEEDREFLLWRQQLQAGISEWERTSHDEGALLRGTSLRKARKELDRRHSDFLDRERSYILASTEYERVEELARERTKRRRRTAMAFSAAMTTLFVISMASTWLVLEQRQIAERQAVVAEAETARAEMQRAKAELQAQMLNAEMTRLREENERVQKLFADQQSQIQELLIQLDRGASEKAAE